MQSKAKILLAKKRKLLQTKKRKQELSDNKKQNISASQQDNEWEWEAEEEASPAKIIFKIEGKDVSELNKPKEKGKKKKEQVAWKTDPSFLKADKNSTKPKHVSITAPPSKTGKTAFDIKFGRAKPRFGNRRPFNNFEQSKNNQSGFSKAKIGRKNATKLGDQSSSTKKSHKYGCNQKNSHNEACYTKRKPEKYGRHKHNHAGQRDYPKKCHAPFPYKKRDDFFGNFRQNNKHIKAKDPSTSSQATHKFFPRGPASKMGMVKDHHEFQSQRSIPEDVNTEASETSVHEKFNSHENWSNFTRKGPKFTEKGQKHQPWMKRVKPLGKNKREGG
ncbi:unnamed protein product [Moneuplotes crassus]|uniref:Uncharacterized protein n=1 Tax=Euplotes crassus TaxID=5936 RepID=A0AAD1XDF7_EUPCR|nr:unnamed protein product [Moneuplotes crassus]